MMYLVITAALCFLGSVSSQDISTNKPPHVPDIEYTTVPEPDIPTIENNPTFRWSSRALSRSSNIVPDLHIRFTDGSQDTAVLKRYTPFEYNFKSDPCTFTGTLRGDPTAVVGVTGCPDGDDQYHVTLLTKDNRALMVHVNRDGSSEHVETPEQYDEIVDRIMPMKSVQLGPNAPVPTSRALPAEMFMRVVAGYDSTILAELNNDHDAVTAWMASVFTHVQTNYHAPTLDTKITFDTPVPMLDMSSSFTVNASVAHIESLILSTPQILEDEGNAHHFALFCSDTESTQNNILGIAFLNAICYSNRDALKNSINEYLTSAVTAALVVTHEIGHNLGMGHDNSTEAGNCEGFMSPSIGLDTWSACSNTFLETHYNEVIAQDGSFCLERDDPSSAGGSWTPWGSWSTCTANCGGGTRTRDHECAGAAGSCAGSDMETEACNEDACPVCTDLRDDCPLRGSYWWCGGQFDFMLENCPQECNQDRIPTATCALYSTFTFGGVPLCDNAQGSNNFIYMMHNCGQTCGKFCPA